MDATLKKRMQRVTRIHFVLTVIAGLLLLNASAWSGNEASLSYKLYNLREGFKICTFVILQPQTLLMADITNIESSKSALQPTSMVWFVYALIYIVSIPVWSVCFGWIFIRIKDRLHHFPVLGKRVL